VAKQSKVSRFPTRENNPLKLTLENGVVVKIRPVPSLIVHEAVKSLKKPDPPMYKATIDGKETMLPNFDDPAYDAQLAIYHKDVVETAIRAMALYGAEPVSLPDEFPDWDDDAWIDELESYGLTFDLVGDGEGIDISTPGKRKVAWKKHIVFTCNMTTVYSAVKTQNIIEEAKVIETMQYFRDNEERIRNFRTATKATATDGDSVASDDTGDSLDIRGNEGGEESSDAVEQVS
jgi:hypothetical protein